MTTTLPRPRRVSPAGAERTLTPEQRRQYETQGYLVVPDLLTPAQVDVVKQRVDLLARHRDNRDAIDDGTMYFQKIQFILEPSVQDGQVRASGGLEDVRKMGQVSLDPVILRTLALNPTILPRVRQLLGPEVRLPMSALFAKPSGHGSETPWHQDQGLWKIRLPTAVSCWVALDEATKENGCLQMVPGSHQGGLIPHVKNPDAIHPHLPDGTVDPSRPVYVEMRAGTGVFFSGTTWHYSAPNASVHRRLGVVCVYVADAEYRRALEETGDTSRAKDTIWALRHGQVVSGHKE